MRLPISGRVARTVPKFCARANPGNHVTPCAGRNKEFLARGVFYLLDCCTNVVVRRVSMNHRKKRFKGVGDRVSTHREPRILTTGARRSLSPCHSQAKGDGSWAEPLGKTAHRRIPSEGVPLTASPSGFSPPPLVPGLFCFRARVILLPDDPTPRSDVPSPTRTKLATETWLPVYPTRPTQRLTVRGQAPTFPPPEPPLLFSFLAERHARHESLK